VAERAGLGGERHPVRPRPGRQVGGADAAPSSRIRTCPGPGSGRATSPSAAARPGKKRRFWCATPLRHGQNDRVPVLGSAAERFRWFRS
jgi:hypothetical protein